MNGPLRRHDLSVIAAQLFPTGTLAVSARRGESHRVFTQCSSGVNPFKTICCVDSRASKYRCHNAFCRRLDGEGESTPSCSLFVANAMPRGKETAGCRAEWGESRFVFSVWLACLWVQATAAHAQVSPTQQRQGTIRGTVLDASSGRPVIGAGAEVVEVKKTATRTDLDGHFDIDVAPGTYLVRLPASPSTRGRSSTTSKWRRERRRASAPA